MKAPRLGCGVAVVREGKLLLIKRRRNPEAGCWGLPGGKVDWMEPADFAAARELLEETGLESGPLSLLGAADQIDRAAKDHWFAPFYLAQDSIGEPVLLEPSKHEALGWFELGELPSPLTTTAKVAETALLLWRSSKR